MRTGSISILVTLLIAAVATPVWAGSLFAGPLDDLATLKPGRTMRASSSDPNWAVGNGDARPIEPGDTLVVAELEGPGVINHIWNTIASQERGYSRLLVLRMYWDGEEQPSVEVPIGDFFGVGHGMDVPFDSLPVRVTSDGRGRNCYWPMPFRKSAKITVTNEGRLRTDAFYYYVDWQKLPSLPDDTAYLHAMYRQEYPATMGQRYLIADIEGRGHYAGTVLNCRQNMPNWFGEGDDFFYIDGEEEPSLRGTGTEDYFCDGWGFRVQSGAFYGAPVFEGFKRGDRTSVYRWHVTDPVTFTESLRLEIEHVGPVIDETDKITANYGERPDDFSSVAFWYQLEPHKPYPDLPKGYDRLYFDYSEMIEAESLLDGVEAPVGPVQNQEGGAWSKGGQLFWTPQEPNQSITIPFVIDEGGTYYPLLMMTYSFDYGIFQYELDGAPLAEPIDQYHDAIVTRERQMPPRKLEKGTHTLTVRNLGKNAESAGYYFGLDGFLLLMR
ncbi:MAG: DUF2961 domain-containing protein [Candidatus Hydrogenedentes bacterium]|nr:DUF2961 domain-containing protein [Candidatus Hydrogenedentota bacterium]